MNTYAIYTLYISKTNHQWCFLQVQILLFPEHKVLVNFSAILGQTVSQIGLSENDS